MSTVKTINGLAIASAKTRNGLARASIKTINGMDVPHGSLNAETITWRDGILALGGSVSSGSITIADTLITQIQAASYGSKIVWLLPLIGDDILAARMPLRDTLAVGAAANTGFVDADFSESTGLANPTEATKYFDTLIQPSQLGTTKNGGLGFWEGNYGAGTGQVPMGCRNTGAGSFFNLNLNNTFTAFIWGSGGNAALDLNTAINAHYFGPRASATSRKLFRDGTQLGATNTTSDAAATGTEVNIWVMGLNYTSPTYWKGTCKVAYMTDGTMSDADIAAFHTLLGTYLMTPFSR